MTLKVFSLFSGIGSFEKALDNLNIDYELVGWSEIDKFAIESYKAIHDLDDSLNYGDVTQADKYTFPDFDLLVGGSPCQSFSVAGNRKGFEDTRGTLFFDFAETLKIKQPRYFVYENVKGLVNHNKGSTLDTMIQVLCDIGYTIDFNVLNSKYFGVPQNRERLFVIGKLDYPTEDWNLDNKRNIVDRGRIRLVENVEDIATFNFDWPAQEVVKVKLKDILEEKVDQKYYLSDEKTNQLTRQMLQSRDGKEFKGNVDDKPLIDDQGRIKKNLKPLSASPTIRRGSEPRVVEPIEDAIALSNIYGGFKEGRARVHGEISPTIRTAKGGGHIPSVCEVKSVEPDEFSDGEGLSYCIDANYHKGISPNSVGKGRRTHVKEVRSCSTRTRSYTGQPEKLEIRSDDVSNTITSVPKDSYVVSVPQYRIRRLTPLECFRLQAFGDEDFQKCRDVGISDTQLYKQAGNSITVSVVEEIFKKLFD